MRFRIVAALVALGFAGGAAAAEFSSLEERMSEQEFRASGLEKLSAEELAALNAWLRSRQGEIGVDAGDRVGFKSGGGLIGDNSGEGPVRARILGTFTGWSPGTVLELDNGQAWRIDDERGFSVGEIQDPEVTIEPAMLGSWLLQVEGYNRAARVTRVR